MPPPPPPPPPPPNASHTPVTTLDINDGHNGYSRRPTAFCSSDIIGESKYGVERSNRQRTHQQCSNKGDANISNIQRAHEQEHRVKSLALHNDGRIEDSRRLAARYRNDIDESKYDVDRSNRLPIHEQRSNEKDANRSNAQRAYEQEQRDKSLTLDNNDGRNEDSRRHFIDESKYDAARSNVLRTHEQRSNEGDANRSNAQHTYQQPEEPGELLTSDSNAKQKMQEETSPNVKTRDGRNEDSHRPTAVYSNDCVDRPKDNNQVTHPTIDMIVPLWLQRNRQSQDDLYFYLIGNRYLAKRRGNSTVGIISRHTNCTIQLNYNSHAIRTNNDPLPPITIALTAHSYGGIGLQDLNNARIRVQELLLGYVGNDGSRGRLLYEVALSCRGPHRPEHSTSGAIKAFNPLEGDSEDPRNGSRCWITVLELPYVFEKGRKDYQAAYLLRSDVLTRLKKKVKCYFRVVGEKFRMPVKLCDPYLLVSGRTFQEVDIAAEILGEEIRKHMKHNCSCMLPR
mmetsp:Transcript_13422/g.24302  ORF Transcript_13422/g.24302 Transcript_13422/m.24302 type:complete len:510 (+) Transcript_13422:2-1531(+)